MTVVLALVVLVTSSTSSRLGLMSFQFELVLITNYFYTCFEFYFGIFGPEYCTCHPVFDYQTSPDQLFGPFSSCARKFCPAACFNNNSNIKP